jgi:DNA-binding NarL/FixJ family response regulator
MAFASAMLEKTKEAYVTLITLVSPKLSRQRISTVTGKDYTMVWLLATIYQHVSLVSRLPLVDAEDDAETLKRSRKDRGNLLQSPDREKLRKNPEMLRAGCEQSPYACTVRAMTRSDAPGPLEAADPGRIRALIADSHPIVRQGLRELLNSQGNIQIIGEVADADSLVAAVKNQEPDVVLLEIQMLGTDWAAVLRRLQGFNKRSKILVLTESTDRNEFVEAMRLGCSGVMLKDKATELIIESISKVHGGEIWLDSVACAAIVHQFASGPEAGSQSPLSRRQREIAALVAQGYKNSEIAEKLSISEMTVKNHLHTIFGKLNISDRIELALYAIHSGLCSPIGT